jgi:hypothetical protein
MILLTTYGSALMAKGCIQIDPGHAAPQVRSGVGTSQLYFRVHMALGSHSERKTPTQKMFGKAAFPIVLYSCTVSSHNLPMHSHLVHMCTTTRPLHPAGTGNTAKHAVLQVVWIVSPPCLPACTNRTSSPTLDKDCARSTITNECASSFSTLHTTHNHNLQRRDLVMCTVAASFLAAGNVQMP